MGRSDRRCLTSYRCQMQGRFCHGQFRTFAVVGGVFVNCPTVPKNSQFDTICFYDNPCPSLVFETNRQFDE